MNSDTMHPKNESNQEHIDAAERGQQFMLGWFAHPIYKDGDYPKVMKDNIGDRLPKFTPQEIALNKGSFDFFGLNHYTTVLAEPTKKEFGFPGDVLVQLTRDPSWTGSGSYWLKVVPWGFRDMLNWIKKEYNNPKVIITENGITDNNGTTNDPHRIYYYRQYINQLLKAVKQDECNVIGYTAWCLLDTFEWNRGFHEKFGLHSTDFSDPTRPRTPKLSAAAYTEIVNRNGFPPVGIITTASSGSSDAQNFIMLILLSVSFYCILKE